MILFYFFYIKIYKHPKKNMSDCSICYFSIDGVSYHCLNNTNCSSVICGDCLKSYIEYLDKDNLGILPKCPDKKCNNEYTYSEIKRTDNNDIIKTYEKLCFDYIKKEKVDDLIISMSQDSIIERIRQEKLEFIKKSFPIAISYVVENSLKSKLLKISKNNSEHIKKMIKRNSKKCPNSYCVTGYLDSKLECLKCFDKFCEKCEQKIKTGTEHKCKDDDLKTIEILKDIIKCPTCHLPITKSSGCNYMTCASCGTKFDYISGNKTTHGGHSTQITLRRTLKQSVEFKKENKYDEDIIRLLVEIEEKEPSIYNFDRIMKILKEYLLLDEVEQKIYEYKVQQKITTKYEKYLISKQKQKNFYNKLDSIQRLHDSGVLTKESLDEIIVNL